MHPNNPIHKCGFNWITWKLCPLMRDYFRDLKVDLEMDSLEKESGAEDAFAKEIEDLVGNFTAYTGDSD
jgi:hypothetical protein